MGASVCAVPGNAVVEMIIAAMAMCATSVAVFESRVLALRWHIALIWESGFGPVLGTERVQVAISGVLNDRPPGYSTMFILRGPRYQPRVTEEVTGEGSCLLALCRLSQSIPGLRERPPVRGDVYSL